ncbi:hypothetical protein Bca101_062897 [Brassica carinata]
MNVGMLYCVVYPSVFYCHCLMPIAYPPSTPSYYVRGAEQCGDENIGTIIFPLSPLVTLPHCQTQIVTNVAMSFPSHYDEHCIVSVKFLGPQLSLCRPAQRDCKWINIRIKDPSFVSFHLDEEGNGVYTKDIGGLCILLFKAEPICIPSKLNRRAKNCVYMLTEHEFAIVSDSISAVTTSFGLIRKHDNGIGK